MQSFMFKALDEKEYAIVVDAIEEVKGGAGDVIIKEGDQGDHDEVMETAEDEQNVDGSKQKKTKK